MPPPALPPPPPWLLPEGHNVVDDINGRFTLGKPSPDLESAGVLVRAFDGLEYPLKPWLPCPKDQPWLRMCASKADRFPTSLLWPQHTETYKGKGTGMGGVVIRPHAAKIKCSYHGDGFTMSKGGEPCPESNYCDQPGSRMYKCSWRASQLMSMMEHSDGSSHNEVVLDSQAWVEELPSTIEAIFLVDGDDEAKVRKIHQDFMRDYGLTVEAFPLLRYDPKGWPPFERFNHAWREDT